jgi:hypothetical protein
MAALMESPSSVYQSSGNLKSSPCLGLRGDCHYCHLFSKSSRKIKIQKSFANYVATLATTPDSYAPRGHADISQTCVREPS